MEIRVAICEKESQGREYLIANIRELPLDINCTEFSNGYDLTELFEENNTAFDVVFINSNILSRGDGLEVARKIRECSLKVAIIIMSDCRDYYKEAFDVFAMGYLINPASYRDIEKCFTFYTKNTDTDRRASWMVKSRSGHWYRIFCRDILYIESDNREYIVHLVMETTSRVMESLEMSSSSCLKRIWFAAIKVISLTCSLQMRCRRMHFQSGTIVFQFHANIRNL